MTNTSQLLLLADHVKLSLLERQRAISLNLEPNSHDGEIARSLESLGSGLQELEAKDSGTDAENLRSLRSQYSDLYAQFHGEAPPQSSITKPNDPFLSNDFSAAQKRPSNVRSSSFKNSSSGTPKSVRFRDDPSADDAEYEANRAALLPYTDEPDDAAPDHSALDNQQVHEYHSRVLREQDTQLDRLSESVGRQRHLSIQIGDELDEQSHMIDDLDQRVDRHQTSIDRARNRLGKIARKAKDNIQLTVIFILIIVLVLLIIILER